MPPFYIMGGNKEAISHLNHHQLFPNIQEILSALRAQVAQLSWRVFRVRKNCWKKMPGYPSARTRPRGWHMNLLNSTNEVLLKHTLQSTSRYQTPRNCCIQFRCTDSAPSDRETDEPNSTARTGEWKWKERKAEAAVVPRGNKASTEKPTRALVYCSCQPLQTSISRLSGVLACLEQVFFQSFWLVSLVCCGLLFLVSWRRFFSFCFVLSSCFLKHQSLN